MSKLNSNIQEKAQALVYLNLVYVFSLFVSFNLAEIHDWSQFVLDFPSGDLQIHSNQPASTFFLLTSYQYKTFFLH